LKLLLHSLILGIGGAVALFFDGNTFKLLIAAALLLIAAIKLGSISALFTRVKVFIYAFILFGFFWIVFTRYPEANQYIFEYGFIKVSSYSIHSMITYASRWLLIISCGILFTVFITLDLLIDTLSDSGGFSQKIAMVVSISYKTLLFSLSDFRLKERLLNYRTKIDMGFGTKIKKKKWVLQSLIANKLHDISMLSFTYGIKQNLTENSNTYSLSISQQELKQSKFGIGSIVCILGKTGTGKTSFLKSLCGEKQFEEYTSLRGYWVNSFSTSAPEIAFTPQDPEHNFLFHNLHNEMKAFFTNAQKAELKGLLNEYYMNDFILRDFTSYSSGELKLLSVMWSFATGMKIVLLDEPFAHLDPMNANAILQLMYRYSSSRLIVFTSHYDISSNTNYKTGEQHIDIVPILQDNFNSEVNSRDLVTLISSYNSKRIDEPTMRMSVDAFLSPSDYKEYDDKSNRISVILGCNGSGKTTLLRQIINTKWNRNDLTDDDFIFLTQSVSKSFFENTSRQELFLGIERVESRTIELAHRYILPTCSPDEHPLLLSRGQQQLLLTGTALLSKCKYILIDEPFTGLDPQKIEALSELFIAMNRYSQLIITAHSFDDVEHIAKFSNITYLT
jgi:ABC-type multidrug transport system ATPase subunit